MKRPIFSILVSALFVISANAQEISKEFDASNPTQLYTNLGVYSEVGNYFFGNGQLGVFGEIAVNNFKLGFLLPFSYNIIPEQILGNVQLDMAYRVPSNSGRYEATLIKAGVRFPSLDERYTYQEEGSTSFLKFYVGYQGSVKLNNRWAIYPELELFSRTDQGNYYHSSYPSPHYIKTSDLHENGLKLGILFSYRWNTKNFIQVNPQYTASIWQEQGGTYEHNNFDDSAKGHKIYTSVRYQWANKPQSHFYTELAGGVDIINRKGDSNPSATWLILNRIGYVYYLN